MKLPKIAPLSILLYACFNFPSEFKKIAFVKQVICPNLYCCHTNASPQETIFSSFKHSGPVALFTKFNADFYIVETEPDEECMIWLEQASLKQRQYDELLRTTIPPTGARAGHAYPQGYFSVCCKDINWDNYDIVISVNIGVPARITAKYPKTLWCYYILEGSPSYKKSFLNPIKGYDVFLTQDFHQNRELKSHALEFPFQLHYYGCFHELFGIKTEQINRKGINLEVHTNETLTKNQKKTLENITSITRSNGALKNMLEGLMQTKYYIQYLDQNSGHRASVRGNGIVEAIATGNLVIARYNGLNNKDLLSSKTLVHTFEELLEKILYFEANPSEYLLELQQQRKKLDELCCYRPMKNLFEKHTKKNNERRFQ